MAFAAAIRSCLLIMVLAATAAAFSGGTTAWASTESATDSAAAASYFQSDATAGTTKSLTKTPCKRPKAGVHHSCHTCQERLFVRPVGRTRSFLPAPKLKLVVIDTIADRLALASAQAATRLVLASDFILNSYSASFEVIARTARLRN